MLSDVRVVAESHTQDCGCPQKRKHLGGNRYHSLGWNLGRADESGISRAWRAYRWPTKHTGAGKTTRWRLSQARKDKLGCGTVLRAISSATWRYRHCFSRLAAIPNIASIGDTRLESSSEWNLKLSSSSGSPSVAAQNRQPRQSKENEFPDR